jgi:multiple sugar transport system substrate-binding protein
LYLDNSALTELPPEIGQLTKLEWLHMEGTPISELPPDIGQWVNLEWLDLSRTQLRTLPPEIGQWVNLQKLHLNGTKLTALPPEIGNLVNLRELHLYDIGTMTLPPEIGQLTQLRQLSLTNTSITVLPPEIGQLTQLESLELGFTSLIRLPPEIGRLTQLHTLNLTANPIYTLPPEIGQLTNLRELYLSRTQISELPPEFYHLTALRGLYLSATPIRELSPDIAQLTQLVRLTLKDTAIEELPRDFLLLIPNVYQFEYNGRWVNTSPRLTSEDMENRVEIVWQTFSCETTPYQYQELLVDEFNHQQTEIKLTLACINFGQYDPQYRFQQLVDGRESIDVVGLTSTSFTNHFHGQWLDLQPLIDATGYDLSQLPPNIVESYRSDGQLRGLPFAVYPGVLFYNVDLFDAAGLHYPPTVVGKPYIMPDGSAIPWDYDAVIRVGQLLTLDEAGHNATNPDFDPETIVQYGFDHQWGTTLSEFHTFGGFSLLNEDNQVVIPEAWRAQAQWQWDSVWTYHISPTYTDYSNELLTFNPFESGHLAMARSALWYTCCMEDLTARWDLAIQPAYQGQIYAPADMDGFYIHQSTEHPEEAFTVLRYLIDDAGAELTRLYDVFPAHIDLQPAALAVKAAQFPNVQHWEVLSASIPLAPVTYYQQWFPNRERRYPEVSGEGRLSEFWSLLRGETGGSIDLDAELDKLQADLQAIVDTP